METSIDLDLEGFTPEEFADIKQCLSTLLSVRAGSQPYDRNLGIDFEGIVDYPLEVARNALALEIIEKVKTYEPRVEVQSVEFEKTDIDGQLVPHVYVVKAED